MELLDEGRMGKRAVSRFALVVAEVEEFQSVVLDVLD